MNIKRYSQVSENFEPTNEFITTVKASMYGLPKDVDVDGCTAKICWNVRVRFDRDYFSFDIWLSKVVLECVWMELDLEGEVIKEEDKVFEYSAEDIKGSQPENEQLQYTIRPESFEVHINKEGKHETEVYWG